MPKPGPRVRPLSFMPALQAGRVEGEERERPSTRFAARAKFCGRTSGPCLDRWASRGPFGIGRLVRSRERGGATSWWWLIWQYPELWHQTSDLLS